jgi:hypothetical protein
LASGRYEETGLGVWAKIAWERSARSSIEDRMAGCSSANLQTLKQGHQSSWSWMKLKSEKTATFYIVID